MASRSSASDGRAPGPSRPSSAASSSSATGEQESHARTAFEQRRVRHVSSILLRNLTLPGRGLEGADDGTTYSSQTLVRPMARRSTSTMSTGSAHTMRRSGSNHTVRARARRRSSIASRKGASEARESLSDGEDMERQDTHDSEPRRRSLDEQRAAKSGQGFLAWDNEAVRQAVESRMAVAFVSMHRTDDDAVLYRSPVSAVAGLHHQWGRVSDSEDAPDGLDLASLSALADADEVCIRVWARRRMHPEDDRAGKGKQREEGLQLIEPGGEVDAGFQLVQEDVVRLKSMLPLHRIPAFLPPNAVVLGLSLPLAHVKPREEREIEATSQQDPAKKATSDNATRTKRAREQRFFLALPATQGSATRTSDSASDSAVALTKADVRTQLKSGEASRAPEIEDLLRVVQLQGEIGQVVEELQEAQARCDEVLRRPDSEALLSRQQSQHRDHLSVLQSLKSSMAEETGVQRRDLADRHEQLRRRRARLDVAKRLMASEQKEYHDLRARLEQVAKIRAKTSNAIYIRKVVLLRQLEYIYPIELVDPTHLTFSIAGVPLVNLSDVADALHSSKDKALRDDDTISSAFGMVAQMVSLMSVYLDTPLHYPIATAGSRSVIQDGISVMSGPRAFPLFSKGVERYRFDYAHFLLNKDIEQLMNVAGLPILDIRNTLPNLKNLIVTLTASDQPHSKFAQRQYVATDMISLKGGSAGSESSASKEQLVATLGMGHPTREPGSKELGPAPSARPAPRLGMSLLGWGNATSAERKASKTGKSTDANAKGSQQGAGDPAADGKAKSPNADPPMPTVRALGRAS